MPLDNLGELNPRANQSVSNSIANIPEDQMEAFVSNIANAAISAKAARSESLSVVKKNFQDLQRRLSFLSNQIRFEVNGQELKLCIKAPEISSDLPIFFMKEEDTIDLSASLPATLQNSEGRTTILHLLQASFPKLTSSSFFNKETKIPRFVVSSPIPLNQEGKGNFFPQIESEKAKIAYIAWDSSGSQIAKGFKEKICDILLKNKEAFCGVALSQDNFKGIEKGAGVSAHFMTSKVTVIGILITKLPSSLQSLWFDGRVACDIDSDDDNLSCDAPTRLIARGPSSKTTTTFGMLGVQGASVSSNSPILGDRPKEREEALHPFCLEIVPQFSSEGTPVCKEDLKTAIDMQFQEKIIAQLKKLNFR